MLQFIPLDVIAHQLGEPRNRGWRRRAEPSVLIYTLSDPKTGDVRYVGKTVKALRDRLHNHVACAKRGNKSYRSAWIRQLACDGLRPEIRLIDVVAPCDDWAARERLWIDRYRNSGARLTNLTNGGEGCHGLIPSAETRQKRSVKMLGRVISQEQRALHSRMMTGRKLSDEHKAKVSAAVKGTVKSEETRRKLSASLKALVWDHRGEKNNNSKLTRDQAMEIRGTTCPASVFVRKYGITDTTVYGIRKGRLWK